jgi:hypothetical protein
VTESDNQVLQMQAAMMHARGELSAGRALPAYLRGALLRYVAAFNRYLDETRWFARIQKLAREGGKVARYGVYAQVAREASEESGRTLTASWAEALHQNGPGLRKVARRRK